MKLCEKEKKKRKKRKTKKTRPDLAWKGKEKKEEKEDQCERKKKKRRRIRPKLTEPSEKKKMVKSCGWPLTSGSFIVCLITKMLLETEFWKLKTKYVFSFHNSSLKNQRIEWWKQKLETNPNRVFFLGPTYFDSWVMETKLWLMKTTNSNSPLDLLRNSKSWEPFA